MILGIDTSNYTTSVALINSQGELVSEARELLEVEAGKKGLRQSKAVFQHINKLPEVIKKVAGGKKNKIEKIVVSNQPRTDKDSYMPVFRAGESQAKSLASVLGVELEKFSHQEGHLMAGSWSAGLRQDNFLALHISGGTTELLEVNRVKSGFKTEVVAATNDISAGQFIDRIGVELGLSFPAGPELEELAKKASDEIELPVAVNGYQLSFSGPCSAAMRLLDKDSTKAAQLALAVQKVIAQSLVKLLKKAMIDRNLRDLLIVGGVAANQYIRENMSKQLESEKLAGKLHFADAKYSTDNAVGTAFLGLNN